MKKIPLIIVEDHQSMIDGINLLIRYEDSIELLGYFKTGSELLKYLHESDDNPKLPEVILTDVKMPEMNGIELTRTIKKEFPDIQIIAFSMLSKPEIVEQMLDAGVSGYLLKNAPLDLIVKAIKKVHKGTPFFDESLREIVANYTPQRVTQPVNKMSLLTQSERDILRLIGEGKVSSEIAEIRFTAISTVEKHRKNMIRKLGLTEKNDLLRFAIEKKYDLF